MHPAPRLECGKDQGLKRLFAAARFAKVLTRPQYKDACCRAAGVGLSSSISHTAFIFCQDLRHLGMEGVD